MLLNYNLEKAVLKLNKNKFTYYFSDERDKLIAEELNRSFRVILFSLNDYFLKNNFMQKTLDDIINQYLNCNN